MARMKMRAKMRDRRRPAAQGASCKKWGPLPDQAAALSLQGGKLHVCTWGMVISACRRGSRP